MGTGSRSRDEVRNYSRQERLQRFFRFCGLGSDRPQDQVLARRVLACRPSGGPGLPLETCPSQGCSKVGKRENDKGALRGKGRAKIHRERGKRQAPFHLIPALPPHRAVVMPRVSTLGSHSIRAAADVFHRLTKAHPAYVDRRLGGGKRPLAGRGYAQRSSSVRRLPSLPFLECLFVATANLRVL